jgi:hypothetical protein
MVGCPRHLDERDYYKINKNAHDRYEIYGIFSPVIR